MTLREMARSEKGGLASYGIAWLLGVPVTVLVIVWFIFHH